MSYSLNSEYPLDNSFVVSYIVPYITPAWSLHYSSYGLTLGALHGYVVRHNKIIQGWFRNSTPVSYAVY